MREKLKSIIDRSTKCFEELEKVLAVALVGSLARDEEDKWSDADIIIIIEDSYKKEVMKVGWLKDIGEYSLYFKQFGYEVRVLFEEFYDVDYIFFTKTQATGSSVNTELLGMLSDGRKIIYDPYNLVGSIDLDVSDQEDNVSGFEELSDDIWFHIMWAAKKIARGEFWYAYYWTNRGLQDQFLQIVRSDVKNPVRRLRFVDQEVDKELLDKISSTFTTYNVKAIIQGLRKCMYVYWDIQCRLYPRLNITKSSAYQKVQTKVEDILTEVEATLAEN